MKFKTTLAVAASLFVLNLSSSVLAQATLTKILEPATIGPGSGSMLHFTIDNSGSSNPVTGVSFSLVLPAGVTIADPSGGSLEGIELPAGGGRGPGGSFTAPEGGNTITLSNATLAGNAMGTIDVLVTSSVPGMHTLPATTLSSSSGSSMSLPIDLTVATDRPGFTKSFSPSSVDVGQRTTLTFTFDNSLNAGSANSPQFTDVLPANLVVADPPNIVASANLDGAAVVAVPGSDSISLSFGSGGIASGETASVSVEVVSSGPGSFDNISENGSSSNGPSTLLSGKAFDTLDVETPASIHLLKQFLEDPVAPGETVQLEFTLRNFDRNFTATGVAFTDDLTATLAGLTFDSVVSNDTGGMVSGIGTGMVSLTGASIAAGGSATLVINAEVPSAAVPGEYSNTTSTITGTVGGSPIVGNAAKDTLFVSGAPRIEVEFLDDPAASGGEVTLRFTLTNLDPAQGVTDLAFTADVGGTPPPETRTGAVPGMAALGLVKAGGLEPEPIIDPCGPGSVLTIPDPNDTLPSPPFPDLPPDPTLLIFEGGSLAPAGMPGDSASFDVTLTIPMGTSTGAYPLMTSEMSYSGGTSPAAGDSLQVAGGPRLTKSFTEGAIAPGETATITFELSLSESEPAAATNIEFTDDLAAWIPGVTIVGGTQNDICGEGSSVGPMGGNLSVIEFTGGTLQPNETRSFSVDVAIPAATMPGNYTNTTSSIMSDVGALSITSPGRSADLLVTGLMWTKEFIPSVALPGETVTMRFTLDNSSGGEAYTFSFSDDLAAVLPGVPDLVATLPPTVNECGGTASGSPSNFIYSGGTVPAGETCVIEFDVQIPAGVADGDYRNTTSNLMVTGGSPFVLPPATAELSVNSSRLFLEKEFIDDPVAPGGTATLEFTLTNLDDSNPVTGVTFADDLGAALSGLRAVGLPVNDVCGPGSQISGSGVLTLTGGSIPAGGSTTFSVTVQVPAAAPTGTFTNTTSQVTGMIDGVPVTGSAASDDLDVFGVMFEKSFDGPVHAGGTAQLTFTITNLDAANGIDSLAFSDNLDAMLSGATATSLPAVPCGEGSSITGVNFLTFTGGSLGPGASCSFTVDVLIPAGATAGSYPNTSSVLTSNGLQVADSSTADLAVEPPPTFSKSFSTDPVVVGAPTTLVFVIDNSASALAVTSLDFTDNLPAGMVVATPANASTTATGGTITAVPGSGTISYTGGSLAAGASATVEVDVVATASGDFLNTSGDLTSSGGNSGPASDSLRANPLPGFTSSFAPNSVMTTGVSTLTFTVDNTGSTVTATGVDFTVNLPSGLQVATPANATTTCTGGTLTAVSGATVFSYTGGTVASGAACTIEVDVEATGIGLLTATSGDLTTSLGNSGPASAQLYSDNVGDTSGDAFDVIFSGGGTFRLNGTLRPGDVDYFTFTLTQRMAIQATSTGGLNTLGRLFDDSLNLINNPAADDERGTGSNFLTTMILEAGTYFLEVASSAPADSGLYEVSLLSRLPVIQPDVLVGESLGRLRGNDSYGGGGQNINLRSNDRGKSKFNHFARVDNDGEAEAPIVISSSLPRSDSRESKIRMFELAGGRQNVTAEMARGQIVRVIPAAGSRSFQTQTKVNIAPGKKLRLTDRIRADFSGADPRSDQAAVKIKAKRLKRPKPEKRPTGLF